MTAPREDWDQIGALFEAARRLPAEHRRDLLASTCNDERVRAIVTRLLNAHDVLQGVNAPVFLAGLDGPRAAALLGRPDPIQEDPDPLEAGAILGRYRVVRRLGHGGMGVVYLAHDVRLDRPAALKLLPCSSSVDRGARSRFEVEARAASSLDHPNIATVYEIGEAPDGQLFIAMAFYDGETLAQELERGPLAVRRAVSLAIQVADGLAAAHRQGIVHRDIKPANIIVTADGVAKIVDFGIAKTVNEQPADPADTPGTVAYMSPEQTRAESADPRADVWALGATLYEMLAGRRPFAAAGDRPLVAAIQEVAPQPLEILREDAPAELRRIIERCLCKDASARYADAGGLLSDLRALDSPVVGARSVRLRTVAAAASAVVIFALAGAALWPRTHADDGAARAQAALVPRRIAVLPLTNAGSPPDEAWLAGALTDQLIADFSAVPGLRVIAQTSMAALRQDGRDDVDIGTELGVQAVLAGTVTARNDRIRLGVRLVDVARKERLWDADYHVVLTELPTARAEIVQQVATALDVAGDRAAIDAGTARPDVLTEYFKGRYYLGDLDRKSFERARNHFRQAIELDPTFAPAWSGLSDAYAQLTHLLALHWDDGWPLARAAAQKALELDDGLADAHASLGAVLSAYDWRSDTAEWHFARAIQLDPSNARAYRLYAVHLRDLGRFREAYQAARTAVDLDPLSAYTRIEPGVILYLEGRYEEALAAYRRLLTAVPDFTYARFHVALALTQLGRYPEALAALDSIGPPEENNAHARAVRGVVLAMAGRHDEARAVLEELESRPRDRPVSPFQLAAIRTRLGDHDDAIELLERALAERVPAVRVLGAEPIFDPLRDDPRFQDILARAGLPRSAWRRPD